MTRAVRIGVLAALLGAGVLTAAAPPASAGSGDIQLRLAKEKSGPYKSPLRRNVASPGKNTVYLRIQNVGSDTETGSLFSSVQTGDYAFKYTKPNGKNITEKVTTGGGYGYELAPGKQQIIRIRIKAGADAEPDCLYPNTIFGGGDSTVVALGINQPGTECHG